MNDGGYSRRIREIRTQIKIVHEKNKFTIFNLTTEKKLNHGRINF